MRSATVLPHEFRGTDMELIHTKLSSEQEAQRRQAFAEE
jgi:uncharacterized membrane protein